MSMFSLFRMSLSPKPTTRSRARITASGFGVVGGAAEAIGAATARSRMSRSSIVMSSIAALVMQAGEEHREDTVGDDHHENRFHHRGRDLPAERFRRALHGKSFDRCNEPDDQRHERRFHHTDHERADADRGLQARKKGFRTDAAIDPGYA